MVPEMIKCATQAARHGQEISLFDIASCRVCVCASSAAISTSAVRTQPNTRRMHIQIHADGTNRCEEIILKFKLFACIVCASYDMGSLPPSNCFQLQFFLSPDFLGLSQKIRNQ